VSSRCWGWGTTIVLWRSGITSVWRNSAGGRDTKLTPGCRSSGRDCQLTGRHGACGRSAPDWNGPADLARRDLIATTRQRLLSSATDGRRDAHKKLTEGQRAALKALGVAGSDRGTGALSICAVTRRSAGASATARPGYCSCCSDLICRTTRPQDLGRTIRKHLQKLVKLDAKPFRDFISSRARSCKL
jgi:hypothetical protein